MATDVSLVESRLADLIVAVQANDSDDDAADLALIQAALADLETQNLAEDNQTQAALSSLLAELSDLTAQNQVEDDATQAAIALLLTEIVAVKDDLADEEPRSIDIVAGHVVVASGTTWTPPVGNLQSWQAISASAASQALITENGVGITYPSGEWGHSLIRDSDLRITDLDSIEAVGGDLIVRWTVEA